MTDRELMQQALEALELLAWYENPATKVQVRKPRNGGPIVTMYPHKVATEAAAPLRERLAQPEQEPVAHTLNCVCGAVWDIKADGSEEMAHTPDTTPPQPEPVIDKSAAIRIATALGWGPRREWQGLTVAQIEEAFQQSAGADEDTHIRFARAIEAKLKEKNT